MQPIRLVSARARASALAAVRSAPDGWEVLIREPRRSLGQNAKLHAMTQELADAGIEIEGVRLTANGWKSFLVGCLHDDVVVPSIADPTKLVRVRASTAEMSKAELSDLIELAYYVGAKAGHVWVDPRIENNH